ncbi:MAG: hypothetical protein ACYDBX_00195 [Patescibacteria group bacterium]
MTKKILKSVKNINSVKIYFVVFLIYLLVISIYTFPEILRLHSSTITGIGPDTKLFIWFLQWWPYAIFHGINPFISYVTNVPYGVNIAWTTSIPFLSLIFYPITYIGGVYISYNLIVLLSFPLAAFTMFLLSLEFTNKKYIAFIGGLIFGFSPYMIAQGSSHIDLSFIAIVPLIYLIFIKFLKCDFKKEKIYKYSILFSLLVLIQVLISLEIAFTSICFLILGLAIYSLFKKIEYKIILRFFILSFIIIGVIFLPYAYFMFFGAFRPHGHLFTPGSYSTDFLSIIFPTPILRLSGSVFQSITSSYSNGNLSEITGYISIPFMMVIVIATIRYWENMKIKILSILFFIAIILSFGPYLIIDGIKTKVPMPWIIFYKLPIFSSIITERLSLYGFLFGGLIFVVFFDQYLSKKINIKKISIFLIFTLGIIIFYLPKIPLYTTKLYTPQFFTNRAYYSKYIKKDANVLTVFPLISGSTFGDRDLLDQAQSHFYFNTITFGDLSLPYFFSQYNHIFIQNLINIQNGDKTIINKASDNAVIHYLYKYKVNNIVLPYQTTNFTKIYQYIDEILNNKPNCIAGVCVWNVDKNYIQKEMLNPYYKIINTSKNCATCFNSYNYYTGSFHWVGESFYVLSNVRYKLILSGIYRPLGILTDTVTINSNGTKYICHIINNFCSYNLPANTKTNVISSSTFNPNIIEHNGDTRNLAFLIKIIPL